VPSRVSTAFAEALCLAPLAVAESYTHYLTGFEDPRQKWNGH